MKEEQTIWFNVEHAHIVRKNCVIMIMYCYLFDEELHFNSHDTRKIFIIYIHFSLGAVTQSWPGLGESEDNFTSVQC